MAKTSKSTTITKDVDRPCDRVYKLESEYLYDTQKLIRSMDAQQNLSLGEEIF